MKKLLLCLILIFNCSVCFGSVIFDGVDDLMTVSADPQLTSNTFTFYTVLTVDSLPIEGDAWIHTLYTNDESGSADGIEVRLGLDGTEANKNKFYAHWVRSEAGDGDVRRAAISTLAITAGKSYSLLFWGDGSNVNIKVCDLSTYSCTEDAGAGNSTLVIYAISGTNIGNRTGGRFLGGTMHTLAIWDSDVEASYGNTLLLGSIKRIPCQIDSSNLVFYLPLDECADGVSCNGDTFSPICANTITATASGTTGAAETILSYP